MTTSSSRAFPSAFSGGTWAKASPEVLKDIKAYGFNLIGWANNHTLDYLHQGVIDTIRDLDKCEFVHAGVGMNLAEASLPKYLDCASGRVALIAATSTFHESWVAGEQRPDIIGRPGVNPLRYTATYNILPEDFKELKEIAKKIYINAQKDLSIKEGFSIGPEDGVFLFGNYRFRESNNETS